MKRISILMLLASALTSCMKDKVGLKGVWYSEDDKQETVLEVKNNEFTVVATSKLTGDSKHNVYEVKNIVNRYYTLIKKECVNDKYYLMDCRLVDVEHHYEYFIDNKELFISEANKSNFKKYTK